MFTTAYVLQVNMSVHSETHNFTPKAENLKKLTFIACISITLISAPDQHNINAQAGFTLYSNTNPGHSAGQSCTFAKKAEFVLSGKTDLDRIWVKLKHPNVGSGTNAATFFIRLTGYDSSNEMINSQINAISGSNRRQPLIFPASWVVQPPTKIAIEYVPFNMTDRNCIAEIGLQDT